MTISTQPTRISPDGAAAATIKAMRWVMSREPLPPASLLARIELALEECPASVPRPADELAAIRSHLLAAAVRILAGGEQPVPPTAMASPPCEGSIRPAALNLLAADALITYAMESAADECIGIASIADDAIAVICSLGEPPLGVYPAGSDKGS